MPSVKNLFAVLFVALGLYACNWRWHDVDTSTRVHAVGEIRDDQNQLLPGLEVRLVKHWPVEGSQPIEPPASVLFADDIQAPSGAAYGVELIAVATTDNDGWFDILLDASAVRDPRFDADEDGRIVPAYTMVIVRNPNDTGTGVYSYSCASAAGTFTTANCSRSARSRPT